MGVVCNRNPSCVHRPIRRPPDSTLQRSSLSVLGHASMGPLPSPPTIPSTKEKIRLCRSILKTSVLVRIHEYPVQIQSPSARWCRCHTSFRSESYRCSCRRRQPGPESSTAWRWSARKGPSSGNRPPETRHDSSVRFGVQAIVGKLISPLRRRPQPMVRQPVLVAVDPHEVLQAHRDAGLLVGLELGQIDDAIGVQDRSGNQILVNAAV